MNRIYRLAWNRSLGCFVPASEVTRARGKGKTGRSNRSIYGAKRGAAAALAAAAALTMSPLLARAGPTGGQIVSGSGNITQSGTTTTISQSTQNLSLTWTSFNIAPQETVNFVQPSSRAIAVNRIYDTNGTQILGAHFNANGQIFLINPNGILFGGGAQVNVGGLIASTLDCERCQPPATPACSAGSGIRQRHQPGQHQRRRAAATWRCSAITSATRARSAPAWAASRSAPAAPPPSPSTATIWWACRSTAACCDSLAENGGLIAGRRWPGDHDGRAPRTRCSPAWSTTPASSRRARWTMQGGRHHPARRHDGRYA